MNKKNLGSITRPDQIPLPACASDMQPFQEGKWQPTQGDGMSLPEVITHLKLPSLNAGAANLGWSWLRAGGAEL